MTKVRCDPRLAELRRELFERGTSLRRLDLQMRYFFGGISVEGKRVLEIGSGNGDASIWCDLNGATQVISIDPQSSGSQPRTVSRHQELVSKLGLANSQIIQEDFLTIVPQDRWDPVDLVFSINAINHIRETTRRIEKGSKEWFSQLAIFERLVEWCSDGADIILEDCSRSNIGGLLQGFGLPNPIASSIDWTSHQVPEVWMEMLGEAGFQDIKSRWVVPATSRRVPLIVYGLPLRFFLEARLVSWLTWSAFRISGTARREC